MGGSLRSPAPKKQEHQNAPDLYSNLDCHRDSGSAAGVDAEGKIEIGGNMRSCLLKAVEEDLWRVVSGFLAVAGIGIIFIILLIIT
jgi:hypothetical protein